MAVEVRYESRPLDCWGKLRELRRKIFWDTWRAKENGQFLVLGGAGASTALLAGIGGFQVLTAIPTGREMKNLDLVAELNETALAYGYGGDCCATLRVTLGNIFQGNFGRSPSGKIVKPDFHFEILICQGQMKASQLYGEYLGIPSFVVELPFASNQADYLINQFEEAIEWLQKITGRSYDDERLIQAVKNEWESRVLFSRIIECQKAVPAPLSQQNLASFAILVWRGALHLPEVVEFFRMALDEVRDRVKNQVAALPTERCRLMHEGPATWYPSSVWRYPKKYGAIYIGSWLYFTEFGAFATDENNSLVVPKTPQERGVEIRNREDALRALADLYLNYFPRPLLDARVNHRVKMVEDWKADGVVFALDRGCLGNTSGSMESILALKRKGVPIMIYETACAHPREFREWEYHSRFDTFMESLGLKPLE